ncbi:MULTISPECIES: hypothetical protein [Paraburkholderia]|uniref:hypothetical protein n=1 Tax=Paraburkholderia TaxID=1822464 RepID=UPI0022506B91|nr:MULTISPECIES: hypothetical protein [Paraburkholderia]MCX4170697.1 hypothetical protein [Paraburkholderia madseniana]MDQ6458709.1 hypothetical protein [Paraburkholderia madseniana]
MFSKLFATTVRYTVNGSDMPVATFGENRAVESLCGQDAFLDYCERRANGAEQLDAFLASLGRYFIGKPEHLTKCAAALETTAAYIAAAADARHRVEAEKALAAKGLSATLADQLAKTTTHELSDEAAEDLARGMREWNAGEAGRRAAYHEAATRYANSDGIRFTREGNAL